MKKIFVAGLLFLCTADISITAFATDRPVIFPGAKIGKSFEHGAPAKQFLLPGVRPATNPLELCVEKSSRVDNKVFFPSIKAALDYAEAHDAYSVKLTIDAGDYPEPLNITRNTSLMARKTATTHKSPHISGSIHNLSGHKLLLENINIMNAQGVGLEQHGGELRLSNVLVAHTSTRGDIITSGMGIRLTDGVKASIDSLSLWDNASTSLFISGPNTRVKIFNLTIWESRAHPLAIKYSMQHPKEPFSQGLAAVDVSNGALLLVEDYSIKNCEFAGLVARKNGRVHLKSGWVESTRSVAKSGGESYGGTNLLAVELGRLELKNFSTRKAGACGLMAWGGYIKAATGEVTGNAIGFSGHNPPAANYDVVKCVTGKDIRYYENSNNLDTDYLPVPCAPEDASCSGDAACPGVAWE